MNGGEVLCDGAGNTLILAPHENCYHLGVAVWVSAKGVKRSVMKEENAMCYAASVDLLSSQ